MTTKEVKLMILDNFIDWYAGDEAERNYLKQGAENYVKEDHVDEIAQAGYVEKLVDPCENCDGVLQCKDCYVYSKLHDNFMKGL